MAELPVILIHTQRVDYWEALMDRVCGWRISCTRWYLSDGRALINHLEVFAPCLVIVDIETEEDLSLIAEVPGGWPGCRLIGSIERGHPLTSQANLFPMVALGHSAWETADWRRAIRAGIQLLGSTASPLESSREDKRSGLPTGALPVPPVEPTKSTTPGASAIPPPSLLKDPQMDLGGWRAGLEFAAGMGEGGNQAASFVRMITTWFQIQYAAWYDRQEGRFLRLVGPTGSAQGFDGSEKWVPALAAINRPTATGAIDPWASPETGALQAQLRSEGAEWIIPVKDGRELVGWIWLGPRTDRAPCSDNCITAMEDLAGCALRLRRAPLASPPADAAEIWPDLGRALAHEIRNPLAAIRTMTQLLKEKQDDPEFRANFASRVEAEVTRLDEMVSRLETFAEPVAHGETRFDPAELLEDIVAKDAETSGTRIQLDIDRVLPEVTGYPEAVRRCFWHLIRNAREAGGPLERIRIRGHQESPDEVFFDLEDDGEGLPSVPLSRLYSPFYSTRAKGFGLGLASARRLIEAQGGRIELQRREVGTVARLALPVAPLTLQRKRS